MPRLSGGQRLLLGVLGGILLVVLGFGVRAHFETQARIRYVEGLREEMREARATVEACLVDRDRARSIFEQTDHAVDSLRAVVDDAEIPLPEGGRGVEEERYPAYLGSVEAYNLSVREWEAAAAELQDVDARCRTVTEAHNLLVDSLSSVLASEGIELAS